MKVKKKFPRSRRNDISINRDGNIPYAHVQVLMHIKSMSVPEFVGADINCIRQTTDGTILLELGNKT